MRFARKYTQGTAGEIPLTALMDIMFNLVLFFVVTTTFKSGGGIPVKLPAATSRMPEESAQHTVISISQNGNIYLGDALVDEKSLESRLAEVARKTPQILVVVRADKSVLHGRVVSVMDVVRRAGLMRIAIATVEERKP